MLEYRRRGRIYTIGLQDSTPRPGSDKTIMAFCITRAADFRAFEVFVHFPNSLILQNRLRTSAVREIAVTKVQEWLDLGNEEAGNIYVLPEDIQSNPYSPSGISPA